MTNPAWLTTFNLPHLSNGNGTNPRVADGLLKYQRTCGCIPYLWSRKQTNKQMQKQTSKHRKVNFQTPHEQTPHEQTPHEQTPHDFIPL